jgi:hypothetical protein
MYPASCQLISDEDSSPVNGDPESEVVYKSDFDKSTTRISSSSNEITSYVRLTLY